MRKLRFRENKGTLAPFAAEKSQRAVADYHSCYYDYHLVFSLLFRTYRREIASRALIYVNFAKFSLGSIIIFLARDDDDADDDNSAARLMMLRFLGHTNTLFFSLFFRDGYIVHGGVFRLHGGRRV